MVSMAEEVELSDDDCINFSAYRDVYDEEEDSTTTSTDGSGQPLLPRSTNTTTGNQSASATTTTTATKTATTPASTPLSASQPAVGASADTDTGTDNGKKESGGAVPPSTPTTSTTTTTAAATAGSVTTGTGAKVQVRGNEADGQEEAFVDAGKPNVRDPRARVRIVYASPFGDVENYDVTHLVGGHLEYPKRLERVLKLVGVRK